MNPVNDGFSGRQGVAHQLGVEDCLKEHGHQGDPEQREPVSNEGGRPEKKLSASDGQPEHDHTRSNDAHPPEAMGHRRGGQLRVHPGVETGAGFDWLSHCVAVTPPSTYSVCPVMKSEAGETMNNTDPTMSSVSATRPSGMRDDERAVEVRIIEPFRHLLGADERGGDHVDVDAMRRPFGGELLAKNRETALRRAIGRKAASAQGQLAAHRSEMHLFAASALGDHVPRGGLALEHRRFQVHAKHVVEVLFGHIVGFFLTLSAHGIDQNVEAAEMRGDFVDHPPGLRRRKGVETGGIRPPAFSRQGIRKRPRLLEVVPRHRHLRAHRDQPTADGFADAAIATRHQGDLVVKAEQLLS